MRLQRVVARAACLLRGNALYATAAERASSAPEATATIQASKLPNLDEMVPWPWVDPNLPRVLPRFIKNNRFPPVGLRSALETIKESMTYKHYGPNAMLNLKIKLKMDHKLGEQLVRGACVVPFGSGKKVTICVFATGEYAEIARQAGADIVANETLIDEIIKQGEAGIKFDKLIATPDFMKPLAKAGRILGPKGLMPNPKVGTLTTDIARCVREMRMGRLEYKTDRQGNVELPLGRIALEMDKLLANAGALAQSLLDNRPKSVVEPSPEGYFLKIRMFGSRVQNVYITPRSMTEALEVYKKTMEGEDTA